MGASKKVFGKDIEEVTEEDLQNLIANGVAEKKILDYKKQLPFEYDTASRKTTWHETQKVEFAKDVSSFANASGGVFICGIDDKKTGVAKDILGLPITKEDSETIENTMEGVLRAKVKPPIANIQCLPVPVTVGTKGGIVYILEIPKSWRAPHGVASNGGKGGYTFWARSDAKGKYPLEVRELQEAFNLSQTITDRIRRFREDRIAKIISGETPARLYDDNKVILHLIPLNSFDPAKRHDLAVLAEDYSNLQPFSTKNAGEVRYNVDGLVSDTWPDESGLSAAYIQVFRNGIIESVDSWSFVYSVPRREPHIETRFLSINEFEASFIDALTRYLHIYRKLNVETPVYLFVTIAGVFGVKLLDSAIPYYFSDENTPIDRDIVIIPEGCIKNYDDPPHTILKDILDSVWNTCGRQKSLNYNEDGSYANRQLKRYTFS